jgi:hypothetical protein
MGLWTIEHVMHSSHEPSCSARTVLHPLVDVRLLIPKPSGTSDCCNSSSTLWPPATRMATQQPASHSLAEIATIMLAELHDLHKRSGR